MKQIFMALFFLSLLLTGCKTEMNDFNQYIEKLQASRSSDSELQNAKALNEYASDQHLSYSIEIKDLETSSLIRMDELDQALGKQLSVTISVSESDIHAVWKPIDNSNVFILLRE